MNKKIKNNLSIVSLADNNGCFDLQFRKDTRYKRINSPTYYRWKTQFIITSSKNNLAILKKAKTTIGCGKIHIVKDQARFSVQKIDDIADFVIPFFQKNKLTENKKKDFEMWQKAVSIIHRNKGKYILKWKKNDLLSLMAIHKSSLKYKKNSRTPKWITMAKKFADTI